MEIKQKGELFLDVEVASSIFEKMKGLMFREPEDGKGLLMEFKYEGRWGVWMLFVPDDLTLFFLDREKTVVDKEIANKMTLDPGTWKVYKPKEKCKYILECKPEVIDKLEIGDVLEW